MERDSSTESNTYERLDTDLAAKDPADVRDEQDDTDVNRRDTLTHLMDTTPTDPKLTQRNMAIYGETDLNPHEQDQYDAHHNEAANDLA